MPKIAINVPQPFHKTVPCLRNKVLISPGVRTLISIKLYRRPKKLQNQFLWFVALKADCRAEDADDTEDAATEQWGDSRALSCQLGYGWWCCWPCQNDTQGAERRGGPSPSPATTLSIVRLLLLRLYLLSFAFTGLRTLTSVSAAWRCAISTWIPTNSTFQRFKIRSFQFFFFLAGWVPREESCLADKLRARRAERHTLELSPSLSLLNGLQLIGLVPLETSVCKIPWGKYDSSAVAEITHSSPTFFTGSCSICS